MQKKQPTAAILIIGNEILSGRTIDKNGPYIAHKLFEKGISLREIRVIPDVEATIISAIQYFSAEYDHVFTTGGIGPTHDDITADAMAKAFETPLVVNDEAKEILRKHYGGEEFLTDARLRMARIPVGASLIANPVSSAPGFKINNVHVMAGVPRIMQAMLDQALAGLENGAPILSYTVQAPLQESVVAEALSGIQQDHPEIDIGSYPYYKEGVFGTAIVLKGIVAQELELATDKVEAFMRHHSEEVQRNKGML